MNILKKSLTLKCRNFVIWTLLVVSLCAVFRIVFVIWALSSKPNVITAGYIPADHLQLIKEHLSLTTPQWDRPIGISKDEVINNILLNNVICIWDSIENTVNVAEINGFYKILVQKRTWGSSFTRGFLVKIKDGKTVEIDSWCVMS